MAQKHHEKGSLILQDLGYFNLARMKQQSERGVYWISRLFPNTKVFNTYGQEIDLHSYLMRIEKTRIDSEIMVAVGQEERVDARLIVCRLPQLSADRRRQKLKDNARKHGRKPTAKNLAFCDWNIFITNVEVEKLSTRECLILYRVRWQVELLFKLWKTHSQLGKSRSKNPYRILTEIFIKLLAVLIQHWILLTGLWEIPQRSLVKATQLIKEQCARFAEAVQDEETLLHFLRDMSERFAHGCRLNKRKKRPNTCDRLIACHSAASTPSTESAQKCFRIMRVCKIIA